MTDRRTIRAAVDAVVEANPLPESLDDVNATVRRDVEREAARRGVSPADVWREVRAADEKRQADAKASAEVVAAIKAVRKGLYR